MSGSDQDFSENSCPDTPQPGGSATSSPSQQVPQVKMPGLTGNDDLTLHNTKITWLQVIEQPQSQFRFRYQTEMGGTHGCILGRNSGASKTYPTVKLMNYKSIAEIRCQVIHEKTDEEHPHQLVCQLQESVEEMNYAITVPNNNGYLACFSGLGIIHRAKRDVPDVLYRKHMEANPLANTRQVQEDCKALAKSIDLNVVRLRFSAHDANAQEICRVISEPVFNMKSVATNQLEISRYSLTSGKATGGEDMFLLVEKVSKKNIKVRFYQLDENGECVWSQFATFCERDVHHQYAIVCRTPAYRDPAITSDVNVYFELFRKTDGSTSEPKVFTYKANPVHKFAKKRKWDSSSPKICLTGNPIELASEPIPPRIQMTPNEMPQTFAMQSIPYNPMSSTSGVQLSRVNTAQGVQISQLNQASGPQILPIYKQTPQASGVQVLAQNSTKIQNVGVQSPQTRPDSEIGRQMHQVGMSLPQAGQARQNVKAQMFPDTTTPDRLNIQQAVEISSQLRNEVEGNVATVANANLQDLLSNYQPTQPSEPFEEEPMLITDATVSDSVNNQFSYVILPTEPTVDSSVIEPAADLYPGTEAGTSSVLWHNPMLSEGQPNIINPVAAMRAHNLNPNLGEFARFQAGEFFDTSEIEDSFRFTLSTDSAGVKDIETKPFFDNPPVVKIKQETKVCSSEIEERPAFYKVEDLVEVKKLLKDIHKKVKDGCRDKEEFKSKLEKLCDIRLLNGDTILHMMLTQNQASLESIVTLIHAMKMPHLLNLTNDLQQTILHLAVIHDLPKLVAFLVAKDCDPMIEDLEGNNVIHLAVTCQSSLQSLLEAIRSNNVPCDLNACNFDTQTALHLAAICNSEPSARLLLAHGASYLSRDSEGRTPLHLATYDDYLGVTRALLDSVRPDNVDAVDGQGYTALQIACDRDLRSSTIEIIKLLLNHKADPMKAAGKCQPAARLARRKPQVWALMKQYDVKDWHSSTSDSEDEFQSADEGDTDDEMTSKMVTMNL